MDDVGALVSRHPVRNQRRWVIAAQGATLGLVSAALMVVLVLQPFATAAGRLAGLFLIGLGCGFLLAIVHATAAVRGGPSESFDLHERGIAHTTKSGRRAWSWDQITHIHTLSLPGRFPRNGWDFHCAVTFDDGSTIRFNGLATDAPMIAAALLDHRPDARDTGDQLPGWRFWRWTLPFVAAGCAWIIVAVLRILNDDRVMVQVRPGYRVEQPRYSDAESTLQAIALAVCFIVLVLSLSYLAVGLRTQLRRR